MKNIFSLRYTLLVLICLGTRCGVLAQENLEKYTPEKGFYNFIINFLYLENNDIYYEYCSPEQIYAQPSFDLRDKERNRWVPVSGLGGNCYYPNEYGTKYSVLVSKTPIAFEDVPKILTIRNVCPGKNSVDTYFDYTFNMSKGYSLDALSTFYENGNVSNFYRIKDGMTRDTLDVITSSIFGCYNGSLLLGVIPNSIKLTRCLYDNDNSLKISNSRMITYDQDVVICATQGFAKETYNWRWTVNGNSGTNGFNNMPRSIRHSDDWSQIIVRCSDFFPSEEDYNAAVRNGGKLCIFIDTPTEDNLQIHENRQVTYSKPELIFDMAKSAPNIKTVNCIQETCTDSKDAMIEITFDKEIEKGDSLDFGINNVFKENGYGKWINDKTYVIGNLVGGETYTITFNGSSGFGKIKWDFSGENHKAKVYIPVREPVEFSAIPTEVSCFDGKDGSITISAKGGTGVYKATLFSDEEHKQIEKEPIEFKVAEKVKFENLKAGKYYMVLVDENNCSPKGQEHGHEVVSIDQPLESVKIDTLNVIKIMPKAYNSTDGSISVYVSGGTFTSKEGKEGYTVVLKNSDGVSYSHKEPYIDNGKYMYTFENLPKGKYTMIAQDARYSPSDVNPGDEPCGCMATYSFELIAPDPIKVEIKEFESIRCHGTNGGSLRATAKGGARGDNMRPYIYHWYEVKNDGTLKEFEQERDSTLNNIPAGKYCLVVEDANHTKSDSVYWEIKQPAPIEISFKVANPTFKNKYGSVEAIVKGGTPPYTYEWTKEGVTVNKLDSLETGYYLLRVRDSNKCEKDTTVHVSEPDEIKIDTLVFRHPSCYGTNDGEISLKISGKNSSYTAVWADNKNAGLTRKGLKPGEYTLKVSDSDGNEIELKYKMEQPEQMKLEVGSAFVLCKGQGRMITASSNVEDAEYLWKRNGREIQSAFGSELFVTQDGVYEVICKKKDSDCSVSASVNVSVSDVELPIDITMSTDVEVDEKIHGVNISTAKMDKFEWILPDGAEKVSQSDNEIVFIMHTPGTYTVRAVGYKGGCTTEVLQTLNVKGDGEAPLPTADGDPLLKQFIVSPNPTDKEFNVHIELSEKANIKLTLKSPTGAEVETINVSDVTSYDHGYELNGDVTDCVFTLELSTGDNKQKSIQRIRKTIIKNEEK